MQRICELPPVIMAQLHNEASRLLFSHSPEAPAGAGQYLLLARSSDTSLDNIVHQTPQCGDNHVKASAN